MLWAGRTDRGQTTEHGTRDDLLGRLAEEIGSVTTTHPIRVAIDTPLAAGKTTLADELEVVIHAQGREVIRATIEVKRVAHELNETSPVESF